MKKYLLLTLITLLAIQAKLISQISLINTYNNAVYMVDIEDIGYKYYGIDYETSQVLMYNTDHTLWKTIDILPPENSTIDEIAYVSSKLFNSDDNIELLVVFNEYIESSDTSAYFLYTTKIINENGVTFLEEQGGGYSIIYKTAEDIANLLIYIYDFSVSPFSVYTNVYSIPGVPYSVNEIGTGFGLKSAFPNPSSSYITIPYAIDNFAANANIVIYNELGIEAYRETISANSNNYQLDTKQFTKGVYFYRIVANGQMSVSKKIIIQ
ncbi:MAG: T9SS type A sorting domain-containing protein [Bacteroidota bacterium]